MNNKYVEFAHIDYVCVVNNGDNFTYSFDEWKEKRALEIFNLLYFTIADEKHSFPPSYDIRFKDYFENTYSSSVCNELVIEELFDLAVKLNETFRKNLWLVLKIKNDSERLIFVDKLAEINDIII